jgi:hypothetical protein
LGVERRYFQFFLGDDFFENVHVNGLYNGFTDLSGRLRERLTELDEGIEFIEGAAVIEGGAGFIQRGFEIA